MNKTKKVLRNFFKRKLSDFAISNTTLIKWIVVLIVFIVASFLLNQKYYKPSTPNLFFERAFINELKTHPELLTETQAYKALQSIERKGKLNDVSAISLDLDRQMIQDEFNLLNQYKFLDMTTEEKISKESFKFIVEERYNFSNNYSHLKYPIDHIEGIHIKVPLFMITSHQIEDYEDAEAYIMRLINFQDKISELISGKHLLPTPKEKELETSGILVNPPHMNLEEAINLFEIRQDLNLPPASVLEIVEKQISNFLKTSEDQNYLYLDFLAKIEHISHDISSEQMSELKFNAKRAISNCVYPSMEALQRVILKLQKNTHHHPSLGLKPQGKEYYYQLLGKHLGADQSTIQMELTPKNLFNLANKEIDYRISMLDSLTKMAYDLNEKYPLKSRLKKHQQALEFNGLKEQYKATFNDFFTQEYETFSLLLEEKPLTDWQCFISPDYVSTTLDIPKYFPGSFFGKRSAKIMLLDEHQVSIPRINVWATLLAAQHFQESKQREQVYLPSFRKASSFTFFTEGWMYYHLENKLESYNKLSFRIEAHLEFLQKAVKMAIDIGIHMYHWDYQQALEFVLTKSYMDNSHAKIIIEDVIARPARANAYLIGMERFRLFENKANKTIGELNINKLWEYLLSKGALPYHTIERTVNHYLTTHETIANVSQ